MQVTFDGDISIELQEDIFKESRHKYPVETALDKQTGSFTLASLSRGAQLRLGAHLEGLPRSFLLR